MSLIQSALLSAAVAPFLLAIWAAFMNRPLAPAGGMASAAPCPRARPGFKAETGFKAGTGFEAETSLFAPLARAVAEALEPLARTHRVRLSLAVPPDMLVRADPDALRMALRETMLTAMQATLGGKVLVSALRVGAESHVHVTDDGTDADQRAREGMARGAQELIALQGGTLVVTARRGLGTTVTLRLPMPPIVTAPRAASQGTMAQGTMAPAMEPMVETPVLAARTA